MMVYVAMEHEWERAWILGIYSSRAAAVAAIAEEEDGEEWEGHYFDIREEPLQ